MDNSTYYSENVPKILNSLERLQIGKQLLNVLQVHLQNTQDKSCLDIGCSSGIITNFFADYFKDVVGVDVDRKAIKIAKNTFTKKNLRFILLDNQNLNFKDNSFDVIVCNQVYNFVDDPIKLMNEIERVLKPGGICLFTARNKYALIEPQYNLPFLSCMPLKMALLYMKILGKGEIFAGHNYFSYWQLKKLVHKFKIYDYTNQILKDPRKFGFKKLEKISWLTKIFPKFMTPLVPNYIWVLEKQK